jgi:hypothetical protein
MMDINAILAPAAVLVLWTCIMVGWLAYARLNAVKSAGVDLSSAPSVGGRGQDIDPLLPPRAQWPSHNYTHLLEQPTIFYAVVLILAVGGGVTQVTVTLAWAYAILRIAHSLWQVLVNKVPVRFALFLASTACLVALATMAVVLTLG